MKFKKNVLFKIISVVITISQLTSMMNIGTFAITDEGHNQVKEDAVSVKTMNISDKNEPLYFNRGLKKTNK